LAKDDMLPELLSDIYRARERSETEPEALCISSTLTP